MTHLRRGDSWEPNDGDWTSPLTVAEREPIDTLLSEEVRTCGIHGDDTTGGRCQTCDALVGGRDL